MKRRGRKENETRKNEVKNERSIRGRKGEVAEMKEGKLMNTT